MSPEDPIVPLIEQMVVNAYPSTAPGAALLLVRQGEVLYRRGIGLANLEHQVPMMPYMPFCLASLTKPITATAVLMLVEAGRLALTDSLTDLLPDYPSGMAPITVEHLLTHTSGIPEFSEIPEWWAVHRQEVTVDQLIDLFKHHPHSFAPGTRWSYCNSGYILLGAIIEKVSGKSYRDFLDEHMFSPLGMMHTCYEPIPGRVIPGMVSGYTKTPDAYLHAEYFSTSHFFAAGGLVSTADDLARFCTALCTGNLLNAETLRRMWTPTRLPDGASTHYGCGWWVSTCQERPVMEHYGIRPGYANQLLVLPDDNILVIVLSNDDGNLNQTEHLAVEMAALALGNPYQPPARFPFSSDELSHFAGDYTTSEGKHLVVVSEAGKLVMQGTPEERFALQPLSPLEFFFPEIPESRLVFSQKKDRITGFLWSPRRGMPLHARKTE